VAVRCSVESHARDQSGAFLKRLKTPANKELPSGW
jgi:hypothetical protein